MKLFTPKETLELVAQFGEKTTPFPSIIPEPSPPSYMGSTLSNSPYAFYIRPQYGNTDMEAISAYKPGSQSNLNNIKGLSR